MHEFLWQTFVTLLVVIDPFAVVPVFISLTRNDSTTLKRKTAKKACLIGACLLVSFAFLGDKLLNAMNITEPAFRIAGGFLLLLAAIEMVVAKNTGLRSPTGDETKEAIQRDDISVFPLAIPLIAGPGAITSTVVLMRQAESMGYLVQAGVVILAVFVIYITYLALKQGDRIMKLLGVTGTNVLTRVFGIILAALAVENILTGLTIFIKGALHS
ncbi:MAG: MarC family protein [Alphaproteobacteria bacterium]|jgi:multiple antibiotic resistance protein|nr:MarC family protein [Alphaproteobacteria bacterium]